MHIVKTVPTAIVGALASILLIGISACGKSDKAANTPAQSSIDAAQASASDAQAAASDADAAAAQARANVPAAGTVANDSGENQKTPTPSVSVSEEAQAGAEAPQDLRDRVGAAKAAGRAPVGPVNPKP